MKGYFLAKLSTMIRPQSRTWGLISVATPFGVTEIDADLAEHGGFWRWICPLASTGPLLGCWRADHCIGWGLRGRPHTSWPTNGPPKGPVQTHRPSTSFPVLLFLFTEKTASGYSNGLANDHWLWINLQAHGTFKSAFILGESLPVQWM